MGANFRFNPLRSEGWLKAGLVGAVVVLFGTPMLWAVGAFGRDDGALTHAAVFLLAGVLMFLALGFAVGSALRGFAVKVKEGGEEGEEGARRGGGATAHPPAPSRPPQR